LSPASAQFICGGSATGGEPQAAGGATAVGGSMACGFQTTASGATSVAIGVDTNPFFPGVKATGATSVAIGVGNIFGVNARGTESVAIGSDAQTGAAGGVAIGGASSSGSGLFATAVGGGAFINPGFNAATVVGGGSLINGSNTTVLGANAGTGNLTVNNAVAVGQGASVGADNTIALGQGSSAGFVNSTAIGTGVTTTRANQVAVGTAANTYTLAGVTSAASLTAQTGPISFVTTDGAGNLAALSTSVASVASVAALDGRVTNLENNVRTLNFDVRKAFEGAAVAIAMGGSALPDNKRFAISANWGNFSGENAFGGMAQMRISDNFVANAAIGAGFQRGGVGGRVGGTFAW
jgi:hypothetical protein